MIPIPLDLAEGNDHSLRRRAVCAGGLAALAGLLLPMPAGAQGSAPGRITTRAFARLPSPLVVVVAPLDDSPENLRVRDEMRRVLRAAGHRVEEREAPYRLGFATEVRPTVATQPRGPAAGETTDTLPDRPWRPQPPAQSGSMARSLRYVINATLENTATGRRQWQGSARYDDAEPDRARVLVRLVQPLLAELGKTVAARRFTLD